MCCGCGTSYIVSVHIQCQAFIYTLSLCRGHWWRVRLAKQGTLTPPGHLVSPLFCRVRECPPWCSIVGATVTVHQAFMAGVASQAGDADSSWAPGLTSVLQGPWMSTVVLYCWCHSDSASVLLFFLHIRISGTEPSLVILSQTKQFKRLKSDAKKCTKTS